MSWWNDKLMKSQVVEMENWWNDKMMKLQMDKMSTWSYKMLISWNEQTKEKLP
jgi:hypothetical protein